MLRNFVFSLIAIVVLTLSGGSTYGANTIGGQPFPEASQGFMPKVTYDVDKNQMWTGVMVALTANSIAIAVSSKDAGQITTDYITGQTTSYGPLGLGGVSASRYKYNFFITGEGTRTRLIVKAILESSLSGASGTTGYRDIGDRNAKILDALQNWMYEQIEKKL